MRKRSLLFSFLLAALGPALAQASEIRVDSMGDLTLVATDEETAITPYDLGNPAGLALLAPQTRVEITPSWEAESDNLGDSSNGFRITSFPTLAGPSFGQQYQGLVYVDPGQWGFQISGSYDNFGMSSPGSTGSNVEESGFGEAALNWGPFSLGTMVQYFNDAFTQSAYAVNDSGTELVSNTGLLANIPLGSGNQTAWLRIGGSFEFEANPNAMYESNAPAGTTITSNIKNMNDFWTPCLFVEVPKTFQGGILMTFGHLDSTDSYNLTNSSYAFYQPPYANVTDNSWSLSVLYKMKMGFSEEGDPHPLTFNHGLLLNLSSDNVTEYSPGGSPNGSVADSNSRIQWGAGFEKEKEFTLGVQLNAVGTDFNNYGFYGSLGGEVWVASQWALRLGMTYLDDNALNGAAFSDGLLAVEPGQEITGFLPTIGLGYEDKGFKADGMFWYEKPQSTGPVVPNPSYTLCGIGLSVALSL